MYSSRNGSRRTSVSSETTLNVHEMTIVSEDIGEGWKLESKKSEDSLNFYESDKDYDIDINKPAEEKDWCLLKSYETREKNLVKLVEWEQDDFENPRNWGKKRKRQNAIIGIIFCGLVSACISAYSISMDTVISEFQISEVTAALGIVLFSISFGTFPLLTAPLSELFGRQRIYIISSGLFAFLFIPQALASNIATILVSRLISGCVASSGVSLVAGSLTDIYSNEDRALPMSIFSFTSFAATGAAPVALGFLSEHYDFRANNWVMLALSSILFPVIYFFMEETRSSVLLSRRAELIRKETGDYRWRSRGEIEQGQTSLSKTMKTNLKRPVKMLISEPILYSFTGYVTFVWIILYLGLGGIPIVFGGIYGFNVGESGLIFGTEVIGSMIGFAIDWKCQKLYKKNFKIHGIEARLYPAFIGAFFIPIGNFLYAWTAFPSISWVFPAIGLVIIYAGLLLVYTSCFTYLSQSYGMYSSSALAAQSFMRTGVGSLTPLFTSKMYAFLGVHIAGTITGGVGAALIIVPFILFRYGERLRSKSPFASEQLEAEE